jgi:hypothetical protein
LSQGAYSIQVEIVADTSPLIALTEALGTVNQNVQTTIGEVNDISTEIANLGAQIVLKTLLQVT